MKQIIDRILWELRIPSKYRGFRQLTRAIELAVENEDRLLNINRDIYAVIAVENKISTKSVEKNIRTVLNAAWKRGCRERFEAIAGFTYAERPTTGEFLDIVSAYCRKSHLADCWVPPFETVR